MIYTKDNFTKTESGKYELQINWVGRGGRNLFYFPNIKYIEIISKPDFVSAVISNQNLELFGSKSQDFRSFIVEFKIKDELYKIIISQTKYIEANKSIAKLQISCDHYNIPQEGEHLIIYCNKPSSLEHESLNAVTLETNPISFGFSSDTLGFSVDIPETTTDRVIKVNATGYIGNTEIKSNYLFFNQKVEKIYNEDTFPKIKIKEIHTVPAEENSITIYYTLNEFADDVQIENLYAPGYDINNLNFSVNTEHKNYIVVNFKENTEKVARNLYFTIYPKKDKRLGYGTKVRIVHQRKVNNLSQIYYGTSDYEDFRIPTTSEAIQNSVTSGQTKQINVYESDTSIFIPGRASYVDCTKSKVFYVIYNKKFKVISVRSTVTLIDIYKSMVDTNCQDFGWGIDNTVSNNYNILFMRYNGHNIGNTFLIELGHE